MDVLKVTEKSKVVFLALKLLNPPKIKFCSGVTARNAHLSVQKVITQ